MLITLIADDDGRRPDTAATAVSLDRFAGILCFEGAVTIALVMPSDQ